MKIKIWSDIICPYCFIAKKHIEQALDKIPYKNDINIEWKSFQLNPNLSQTETTSLNNYLVDVRGHSENQVVEINSQIAEIGKAIGINFQQQNSKVINSNDAHRLVHYAQENGKGSEVKEALFKAYFTEGKNIADKTILSEIADKVGLNKSKVIDMLNSNDYIFDIESDILEARNTGIASVPFFVIDKKYIVSGAKSVDYFVSFLTDVYERDYLKKSEKKESYKAN